MGRLIQHLLFFLAGCTRNQLIRQIEFLRAENEMLHVLRHAWITNGLKRALNLLTVATLPGFAGAI